jgi:hypothetical protein
MKYFSEVNTEGEREKLGHKGIGALGLRENIKDLNTFHKN